MAKPADEQISGPDRAKWAQQLKDAGLPPGKVPGFAGKSRKEGSEAIKKVLKIKHG